MPRRLGRVGMTVWCSYLRIGLSTINGKRGTHENARSHIDRTCYASPCLRCARAWRRRTLQRIAFKQLSFQLVSFERPLHPFLHHKNRDTCKGTLVHQPEQHAERQFFHAWERKSLHRPSRHQSTGRAVALEAHGEEPRAPPCADETSHHSTGLEPQMHTVSSGRRLTEGIYRFIMVRSQSQ
jgi:hypothetical protein